MDCVGTLVALAKLLGFRPVLQFPCFASKARTGVGDEVTEESHFVYLDTYVHFNHRGFVGNFGALISLLDFRDSLSVGFVTAEVDCFLYSSTQTSAVRE